MTPPNTYRRSPTTAPAEAQRGEGAAPVVVTFSQAGAGTSAAGAAETVATGALGGGAALAAADALADTCAGWDVHCRSIPAPSPITRVDTHPDTLGATTFIIMTL